MRLLLPLALTAWLVAARDCGLTKRINGSRYQVKEVKGSVSCTTVKRVVSGFLHDGKVALHWNCFRGHDDVSWAASCARGSKVLVRVYAPT